MPGPFVPVPPLSAETGAAIRRRMAFEYCKWDVQAEDVPSLSAQPILLTREAWKEIRALAEALAREALQAEAELAVRVDLHPELGLPGPLRRVLRQSAAAPARTQPGPRFMRFDFHATTEGWRISEVNSDVPGGFLETSGLGRLIGACVPGASTPGDPSEALVSAVVARIGQPATVGLVHATAYSDDRQVMAYLSRIFTRRGLRAELISPDQVAWNGGRARISADWFQGPADLLFRFFPAEWLPNLPARAGWAPYFAGSATPLSNPGTALLTQSKRFPLVWDELTTPLPTWRRALPETRDPREIRQPAGEDWVLKPALGRVGEGLGMAGVTAPKELVKIRRAAHRHPVDWVAQRRFVPVRLEGAAGAAEPAFPCVGVFVIDGKVAGAYGRLAGRPLIDDRAQDTAVLVEATSATVEERVVSRDPDGARAGADL